jgi:hypothetical protein
VAANEGFFNSLARLDRELKVGHTALKRCNHATVLIELGGSLSERTVVKLSSTSPRRLPEHMVFLRFCRTLMSGGTRIRTGDTMIFSHVLYQLSYPAGEDSAVILRYEVIAIKHTVELL